MQKSMFQGGQNLSQSFNFLIAEVRQAIYICPECYKYVGLKSYYIQITPHFKSKKSSWTSSTTEKWWVYLQVDKLQYMTRSIFSLDIHVGIKPYLNWNEGELLMNYINKDLKAYQPWEKKEDVYMPLYMPYVYLYAIACATVLRQRSWVTDIKWLDVHSISKVPMKTF